MRFTLFLIIATAILSNATFMTYAQTKSKSSATRPTKPITTQKARTEDGREVILKSDGTWQYVSEQSTNVTSKNSTLNQNSVLSFDTGLVFKSGDVKPVARGTFYLLDESMESIMKQTGFQAPKDKTFLDVLAIMYHGRRIQTYNNAFNNAMNLIKPHVIATITTDFSGKAEFSSVPSGTYYLFGINQLFDNVVVWDLKVDLKSGRQSVTLDQNNAAVAF